MKIALATPPFPGSLEDGLTLVDDYCGQAAAFGARIICFPESFIPGYPLNGVEVERQSEAELKNALKKACEIAQKHHITLILPMDWVEGDQFLNVAHVISSDGKLLGYQAKYSLILQKIILGMRGQNIRSSKLKA